MEIKSKRSRTNVPVPRAPDLKAIFDVDPLQQGQALRAAGKKRKKKQKRAGLSKYWSLFVMSVCGIIILETLFTKSKETKMTPQPHVSCVVNSFSLFSLKQMLFKTTQYLDSFIS